MRRKSLVIIGLLAILTAGCGKQPETAEVVLEEPVAEEVTVENEASIKLYYSSPSANGLSEKTVTVPSLSADSIIKELAGVNVVSYDTEVKSFSQDGTHLALDLSSDFSHYLGMMGTEGEYLVLGGLVNTFLDAYEAEDILVTVEGNTLETDHASYEGPLTYFEIREGEVGEHHDPDAQTAVNYRLGEGNQLSDKEQIYYPQFMDMEDKDLEKEWNDAITAIATGKAEGGDGADYDRKTVDYTIASISTQRVSFLIKTETVIGGHIANDACGLTFDLVGKRMVKLADYPEEVLSKAALALVDGTYTVLADAGIGDKDAVAQYLSSLDYVAEDYLESFPAYDYDSQDSERIPEGTSYISPDNHLILVLDVPEALGGIAVIDTGVEVK